MKRSLLVKKKVMYDMKWTFCHSQSYMTFFGFCVRVCLTVISLFYLLSSNITMSPSVEVVMMWRLPAGVTVLMSEAPTL